MSVEDYIEKTGPTEYDPIDAFSSFTREQLIESIRMWIEKCERAETTRAELLAALHSVQATLVDIVDWTDLMRGTIEEAQEAVIIASIKGGGQIT